MLGEIRDIIVDGARKAGRLDGINDPYAATAPAL
jgi:hypothetical protein